MCGLADSTNFTQDDGDDDVTIGWYVRLNRQVSIPTYQPIVTSSSPSSCVKFVISVSVSSLKVHIMDYRLFYDYEYTKFKRIRYTFIL